MKHFGTLWVGHSLTYYEQLSLKSGLHNGFELHLYCYNFVENVPAGIKILDANKIIPQAYVFSNPNERKTFAGFSNVFRYQLLHQENLVWFDTDVIFLKPSFPESDYIFGYESEDVINGAVLSYPPSSNLAGALIRESLNIDKSSFVWGSLGPKLLTSILAELDLSAMALDSSLFYPIKGNEIWKIYHPAYTEQLLDSLGNSYTLHLWNEVLRRSPSGIKSKQPISGSLISHLFEKFEVDIQNREKLSINEVLEWKRLFESKRNLLARIKKLTGI